MSVCIQGMFLFQISKELTYLHEIRYEQFAITAHPKSRTFEFHTIYVFSHN